MILKSYAKINLFLEVLGKNKDNYHELDSLICFLDLYDQIKIEKSDKLSLEITKKYGDILNREKKDNIILKAIKLMAKEFDFEPNIKVTLEKNLPIGAGMGGGSSNAATIMLALNKIFDLKADDKKLKEIGLKLGADVPICLNNKMALVQGIGEKLTEIKINTKPLFSLIVNPNKHLSTKQVFETLDLSLNKKEQVIEYNQDIVEAIKNRSNDLEKTAIKIVPEIRLILDKMQSQENCLISRMSGSGATCFGLFENQDDLDKAFKNFKDNYPEFYVEKSKLIYEKI